MARIRTIKPEFWTDAKIVKLSPWARLLFIGLWNFADDEGRFWHDPLQLKLQIFPNDKVNISNLTAELEQSGVVRIYEAGGKEAGEILKFCDHQRVDRPNPSKIPAPTGDQSSNVRRVLDERSPPEGKGREGKGRDAHFDFDLFWEKYPRKIAKADARARLGALIKTAADFATLLDALARFRAHHEAEGTDPRYIPYPATFLGTAKVPSWRDWLDADNGKSDLRPKTETNTRLLNPETLEPLV